MSKSFPGRYNDKMIFQNDDTSFLLEIHKKERIVADPGFQGLSNFNIDSPPSDNHKSIGYRVHAQRRQIIERVNEGIKNWAICREKLRFTTNSKLLEIHNQYYRIIGNFVNLFRTF